MIEVAIRVSEPAKDRGDLLENLCEKLLKAQNYNVIKELRNTGAEIDLLCENKVNKNKKIYVECKALRDTAINSTIIMKLIGIKTHNKYSEAWLISTSKYGKDAKGIIEQTKDEGDQSFSFFTPERLIEALINCHEIESSDLSKKEVLKIAGNSNLIGSNTLLVTKFGIFWVFEILNGGKPVGVILTYAKDSEVVKDPVLLEEIANTDTSLNSLDFLNVFASEKSAKDKDGRFIFKEDYLDKMLDTGVKFTHPRKESINIDDIFIYQDLQKIDGDKKVSSLSLIKLKNEGEKIIIFGDDVSGKTTLAYKLQRSFLEQNMIPVYISASWLKSSDVVKIKNLVARRIKRQYKNISNEELYNIDSDKIIVIIDDYQSLSTNKESSILINKNLSEIYKNVYIFSNTSEKLKLMTDSKIHDSLSDFNFYKINEYGFKLRDDLISKWISIGQQETIDDEYKHKRIVEVAETINVTVGNRFVPTYPIFVLTLLQSFEAATTNSLNGSAYAEFYNYLITHALGKSGVETNKFGLFYAYLSELSFSFFSESKKEINELDFQIFHDEFFKRKRLDKKFDDFRSTLIGSKILKFENEFYKFNHNYIYYFFVARYLSEKVTDLETKEAISSITSRLYVSEFANIILFLIHFSKDQFIFDGVVSQAKSLFTDMEPATFEKSEFIKINNLIKDEIKIIIDNDSSEDFRAKEMESKDIASENKLNNNDEEELSSHTDSIKELDIFGKINLSFKLIELLGQLAKNYSELDGDVKVDILKEVYDLGLRSLMKIMSSFEEYTDILQEEVTSIIESKKIHSNIEAKNIANKIVFEFATMVSYGFLAKISNSIASKDLIVITNEIYEMDKTVAKELINMAIDLDFLGGMDSNKIISFHHRLKDNNLGIMMLRVFVTRHLYKFDVNFQKRQKVCEKLSIDVNTNLMLTSSGKFNK